MSLKLAHLLFLPSWVVAAATAIAVADETLGRGTILAEGSSQMIGHTILFGSMIAPLATIFGTIAVVVYAVRAPQTRPGSAWRLLVLVGLSFVCSISGWVAMFVALYPR